MSCGTITRGSTVEDCDLPPGGTRARLILINWDDIVHIYTNDDGKIIDIVLENEIAGGIILDAPLDAEFSNEVLSETRAYEFTGFRNDVKKSEEVVRRGTSKARFIHQLGFVVYDITQQQKRNLERMVKGRFLAIVENRGEYEDALEVLGKECGLAIVDGQIRNLHENSGAFVLNLATPDNGVEFERKLPQTLGTSYDHGQSIIDDLIGEVEEVEGVFDDTFDDTFE